MSIIVVRTLMTQILVLQNLLNSLVNASVDGGAIAGNWF